MEQKVVNTKEPVAEKIDYEKYVVRKALSEYWRAEEKVEIVLMGMTSRIPVTTLCKLNNVSPSQYYEWREKFMEKHELLKLAGDGKVIQVANDH